MSELLSPAGTKESFYAAITSGADAIYLGLDKFSARAYADNFNLDNLKELVDFAHLRNVKIYVTINTIIYEYELNDVYQTIDKLALMGVDAIIAQDLAVIKYIVDNYKSLHAHASTQLGVDDLSGASLVKDLGVKRIVFARETPLNTMREIKNKLGIEIEAFIHGALCVAYSGNCLMSSMIGDRSGNRGRCAGSCRKLYTLVNQDTKQFVHTGYLMSMKDLNVSNQIKDMSFVDSLKIEGRMKDPVYVASVTNAYRHLIDHESIEEDSLNKVFNRTYTKGYMNGENAANITNIERPNNFGYQIGVIAKQDKNKIWIRLSKPLNKGDQIRVETPDKKEEISIAVTRVFDANFVQVETNSKMAIIISDKKVNVGAKVYKTKDNIFVNEINQSLYKKEYRKIGIDMEFNGEINKNILLKVTYKNYKVYVKSEGIVEKAQNTPTTKENIKNQLSKLNDTPYELRNLIINVDEDVFISLKVINELRREAIEKLNAARLNFKVSKAEPSEIKVSKCELHDPEITVEVSNDEQYEAAKTCGIKHIYYKNIVRRNNATYVEPSDEILVGGLNGINHYKDKCTVIADYSLNTTNHVSCGILSSLGASRITLSEEISKDDINELVGEYYKTFNTYPNLELIVYGRSKLMHTKYCPLKRLGMCGECKKNKYALKDEFATFSLKFNDDCTVEVLNSKTLNNIDELTNLRGVNYYRLKFTSESKDEVIKIIQSFQYKLNGDQKRTFNKDKETHGHFLKNPL